MLVLAGTRASLGCEFSGSLESSPPVYVDGRWTVTLKSAVLRATHALSEDRNLACSAWRAIRSLRWISRSSCPAGMVYASFRSSIANACKS